MTADALPRILDESRSVPLMDNPGPAKAGVVLFPHRTPTWNRRKEILYGTRTSTNPASVAFRRMALIHQKLGPATGYYCWIVERIGNRDHTRFSIADAAKELSLSESSLDKYNRKLKSGGWVTIKGVKYEGRNSWAIYTAHPINELIGDEGQPGVKAYAASGRKSLRHKAGQGQKTVEPTALPSSSHPSVVKQAEAGLAVSASFRAKGVVTSEGDGWDEDETKNKHTKHPDTLMASIKTWINEEMSFLISCGFKERTPQSVMKDVLSFLESRELKKHVEPQDQWMTFLDVYPVLKIKLPTIDFIRKGRHTLGVGKLFSPTKIDPKEVYWESFFNSRQYGGIELPAIIYRPGQWILSPHGTSGQVMSVSSAGYLCQLVDSADTMTVKLWDAEPLKLCDDEAPASGAVVLATAGPSQGLATLETPPTAPDEETAWKAQEDADDESLEALLAQAMAETK